MRLILIQIDVAPEEFIGLLNKMDSIKESISHL